MEGTPHCLLRSEMKPMQGRYSAMGCDKMKKRGRQQENMVSVGVGFLRSKHGLNFDTENLDQFCEQQKDKRLTDKQDKRVAGQLTW